MRIAILHNAVGDADTIADRDVLVQVAAVEQALRSLGHAPRRTACTLNLEALEESLTADRPDVVFNLVESLGGSDRLAHLAAVLLEDLDLAYTGTPAAALHLTNNKALAKQRLRAAGLPTPDWATIGGRPAHDLQVDAPPQGILRPPYIIKAVWEHASLGIDDHAVIREGDGSLIYDQIESRARQLGMACFAEQFIEGREFNLSLIAAGQEPLVLPPAEIDFSKFPASKPQIVGYSAKWEESTYEFAHTPRKFDFPPDDAPLLDWLRALAVESWKLFGLRGYARVDFRVDGRGQPWILEINANPCLSPDAGFAAALDRAGVPLERAIEWILDDALRPVEGSGFGIQDLGDRGRETADRRQVRGGETESLQTAGIELGTRDSVLGTEAATAAAKSDKPPKPPGKKPPRAAAVKLRGDIKPSDRDAVRRIVESTGLFRPHEIDVAVELVDARLEKGPASGYDYLFAEQRGRVVGYICFGKNTLTTGSFDIYWIAVEPARHGQGIGRLLLEEAERRIAAAGGSRVYIETSQRADYRSTRGFYERCGYRLAAVLDDFYAPGDAKAIYVKRLGGR